MTLDPYHNIRIALRAQLATFATSNSLSVVWENGYPSYSPTVGTAYIKEDFLPVDAFQSSFGTSGMNRIKGIYQISLFYPAGQGTTAADTMAGKLITAFKRGTDLTYGGQTVEILKPPFKAKAMQEPDWYMIPVKIFWKAETENV